MQDKSKKIKAISSVILVGAPLISHTICPYFEESVINYLDVVFRQPDLPEFGRPTFQEGVMYVVDIHGSPNAIMSVSSVIFDLGQLARVKLV